MLKKVLRALFPHLRELDRLREEVVFFRSFCGVSDGPSEQWDISLRIRDLEMDVFRLQSSLHSKTKTEHHRWEETQRAILVWRAEDGVGPMAFPKYGDLCLWLLRRNKAFEVVPTLASLRRDSKKRWWATTQTNAAFGGDRNLIRLLETIHAHESKARKEKVNAR